jgi:ATP-dependent helicase/nuclease subunit B
MLPLEPGAAAVAILDYKSGGKTFERVKFENGLQLQMPGYLNAICANDGAQQAFGAKALRPAGVFYVGLRAKPETRGTRDEAEAEAQASAAFQHRGRFDAGLLRKFEVTTSDKGQQFKYRFTTKGVLHKTGNDALPEEDFAALLDSATAQIRELGERIFAGEAAVSPYQQGRETACDLCAFRPICRFDSWMQPYRTLKRKPGEEGGE